MSKFRSTQPTSDLSQFDDAVLDETIALLRAYQLERRRKNYLQSGVRLYFSALSRMVYLADAEHNVAVLNAGELKLGLVCQRCAAQRVNKTRAKLRSKAS